MLTHKGERQSLVELNLLPIRSSAQRRVYKSFGGDETQDPIFLNAWPAPGWLGPFAPALPKTTRIKHKRPIARESLRPGVIPGCLATPSAVIPIVNTTRTVGLVTNREASPCACVILSLFFCRSRFTFLPEATRLELTRICTCLSLRSSVAGPFRESSYPGPQTVRHTD